jgi:hypothetical protein
LGEDRWEDPVRQLAQLIGRLLRVVECLVHERGGRVLVVLERSTGQLQRNNGVDETLLRPVVEVAYHPPAFFVGGGHDPRP